jgi:hypothetical protein
VAVLVDPLNRYDVRVGGLAGYWFPSLLTSILALFFVGLGVIAVTFPQFNVPVPVKERRRPATWRQFSGFNDLTHSRDADPGVQPVELQQLRQVLLSLNRDDLPWLIQDAQRDDADLLAVLKFSDPFWSKRICAADVTEGIRVLLRLQPDIQLVRSIDEKFRVSWDDGIANVDPGARYGRGQLSLAVNDTSVGRRPDGSFGVTGHFAFSSDQMKLVIQKAVTQCGWRWRGVMFGRL